YPVTNPGTRAEVPPEQRQLTGDDQKQEAQFNKEMQAHFTAGRYAEAAAVGRQFQKLYERALVPTHPYRITIRSTVKMLEKMAALPKIAQDDQTEAGRLQRQAEKLSDQGRYREAIAIGERVLAIRERDLGGDFDLVASALNALAIQYNLDDDYKKAEELLRKAV